MLANIIDEDKIEFIYKVRILNDKYEMNNSNGLQIGYMIHKDK